MIINYYVVHTYSTERFMPNKDRYEENQLLYNIYLHC